MKKNINYQLLDYISARMQDARRQQHVNLPEFHGILMDEHDILQQQPSSNDSAMMIQQTRYLLINWPFDT